MLNTLCFLETCTTGLSPSVAYDRRLRQAHRCERAELCGAIGTKPGLARYLRTTPSGLLRVDEAAVKAAEKLDGKVLLHSSDPAPSAEDIALGYKQLRQVERGWPCMKQVLDLRPACHRREDRSRAHVVLCWLALPLVCACGNSCGENWPALRRELQKLQPGSFSGPAGRFRQRTELTAAQRAILDKLGLSEPPRMQDLAAALSSPSAHGYTRRPAQARFLPVNQQVSWTIAGNSC